MPNLCGICTEVLNDTKPCVVTLCGHVFHHKCVKKWLKISKTCPECRGYVRANKLVRLFCNFASSDHTSLVLQQNEALRAKIERMDLELINVRYKNVQLNKAVATADTCCARLDYENKKLVSNLSLISMKLWRMKYLEYHWRAGKRKFLRSFADLGQSNANLMEKLEDVRKEKEKLVKNLVDGACEIDVANVKLSDTDSGKEQFARIKETFVDFIRGFQQERQNEMRMEVFRMPPTSVLSSAGHSLRSSRRRRGRLILKTKPYSKTPATQKKTQK